MMPSGKPKRFIISQRRVRGIHKMALGDSNPMCAFCNSKLTVLSKDTYGCFSCNCKYYDYTEHISGFLSSGNDVTLTDIAEQLNVDLQYISEYINQNGIELNKGVARICENCGHVIMDGGECKYCALRFMKNEAEYEAKLKAQKETAKALKNPNGGQKPGMHYIGRKTPHSRSSF